MSFERLRRDIISNKMIVISKKLRMCCEKSRLTNKQHLKCIKSKKCDNNFYELKGLIVLIATFKHIGFL